jgi:hypothetical protein
MVILEREGERKSHKQSQGVRKRQTDRQAKKDIES